MDIDILGIDLASECSSCTVPIVVATHCTAPRCCAQRLLGAVRKLQPRIIAMEACSSAHHWDGNSRQWASKCDLLVRSMSRPRED